MWILSSCSRKSLWPEAGRFLIPVNPPTRDDSLTERGALLPPEYKTGQRTVTLYHKNHNSFEIIQICAHSFTAHFDFALRRISAQHFEWPLKSDGKKKKKKGQHIQSIRNKTPQRYVLKVFAFSTSC